ncbi:MULTISPECIES: hypothetical protein [Streptomyces]|uniref:Uncharacterized protein n=1 Tax=Streptomyces ramulosus TaxID=47762 RepID=A0ABW1FDS0_9ACTN
MPAVHVVAPVRAPFGRSADALAAARPDGLATHTPRDSNAEQSTTQYESR